MAESAKRHLGSKIIGWVVLIAALGGGLWFYRSRETVIEVTATQLTRGHVEQTVTAIASGTVKPRLDSMVAASMIGKVTAIPVKEGDRVKEGDILVELEHQELDSQVALSEANLRAGQSRLEQAKIAATIYEEVSRTRLSQATAQFNLAKLDYERIRALVDKKAVSLSEFDKVAAALRVAQEAEAAAKAGQQEVLVRKEEIRTAEAAIQQLEAALSVAKELRDKALVRAPFAGVIAKVYVNVGEVVGSGGLGSSSLGSGSGSGLGAGTGSSGGGAASSLGSNSAVASAVAVVHLVQDTDIYIKSPFDEANLSYIKPGQKARITLDTYRGVEFSGVVETISPTVTRNVDLTRTVDIDVKITDSHDKYIVGMSADVIIIAQEKEDALFVPGEALIREEEVFLIENGHAVRRKVKTGVGNWQRREILEGAKEGDTIVTSLGAKGLKNNARVRIVENLPES